MAAMVGLRRNTDMEKLEEDAGMALLPWPKHLFLVLWEQLRVLVQVIYYTFVSVFQMLRFEVHLTFSDETGQHIQHMSSTTSQTESFLFSTLFEGNGGVMVGGANPLANFDVGDPFGGTSTEALLSSLRADELCCGLVDDFVTRAAGKDQAGWNVGFQGEWNIFVSSSDCSGSSDSGQKVFQREPPERASEEEWGSHWSSEEDQTEFDSEESKALWESLSRSSDPYNPFFFTACIPASMGRSQSGPQEKEKDFGPASVLDLKIQISRSDSDVSWSSSEGSSPDVDRELLDFFQSSDPFNPMSFTACLTSTSKPRASSEPAPDPEEERSPSTDGVTDEEERLWKSLGFSDDPFHPLNFHARLHSNPVEHHHQPAEEPDLKKPERKLKTKTPPEKYLTHWKKPGKTSPPREEKKKKEKKVRFSPEVQVHVMRSWLFARQASRKGPWEEFARDRARFQRRLQQAEQEVGVCFDSAHRKRMRQYVDESLRRRDANP